MPFTRSGRSTCSERRESATTRTRAKGTENNVGAARVDIGNSFFVDIARGIEPTAVGAGLKLLLADCDMDLQRQNDCLDLFDETRVRELAQ